MSHSLVFRASLCAVVSVLAASLSGCSMTLALDPAKNAAANQTPQASDSAVVALRKMLNMEDPQVRSLAARELGAMGEAGKEGVPSLYALVDDPDHKVRLESARAITRINGDDPVAIPALVMIARDPRSEPEDRREAIATLQQMGPRGQEAATNLALAEAQAVHQGIPPTTRPIAQPVKASANSPTDRDRETTDEPVLPRTPSATPDALPATRPSVSFNSATTVKSGSLLPDTRPSGLVVRRIPGLWRSTDIADDLPPEPDIDVHNIRSYTAARALQVRQWINRQPGTEAERQLRYDEFQRWRNEQDQRIYDHVMSSK